MFIVAVARLASSLDEDAPRLAAELGLTAFEVRQHLLPGLPGVDLATPDRGRAVAVGTRLRALGHDVLAIDSRSLVRDRGSCSLRHFHLEPDAMVADTPAGEQRLAFGDMAILLRATHEHRSEVTRHKTTKKLSAGTALLSGGIKISKKVRVDQTTHSRDVQDVLYVYLRQGPPPWVLPEQGASYQGLGDRVALSERQNVEATLALLRSRAPRAVYDDRLVRYHIPEWVRVTAGQTEPQGTSAEAWEDPGVGLMAHLLAPWITREREASGD